MMIKEFLSDSKKIALIAVILVVVVFTCTVLTAGLGWFSYDNHTTFEPTIEPIAFEYCGERLTKLCVVSFGRDAFGNTIINLYVPEQTYPLFYLNIVRSSGESRYECEGNKNVKTNIYCAGAPINLGEGFEIQLFSTESDNLLAYGSFTLSAFLVATPVIEGAGDSIATEATFTPSPSDNSIPPTPTRTSTPSLTPNYP